MGSRQETYYASVTADDLAREKKVEEIVRASLALWQEQGLVPDWPISTGEKTDEPIRTRGWGYWHHLFNARHLLIGALVGKQLRGSPEGPGLAIAFARALNYTDPVDAPNSHAAQPCRCGQSRVLQSGAEPFLQLRRSGI